MSSPTNRNSRHLSKTTEFSGPVQNSIHVENPYSPKKEKGSMYTQPKNTMKPPDYFSNVGHNNSLADNTEKSSIQTSSSIVSKEVSHQKEFDSGISSCGCAERSQYETTDIDFTKKSTKQKTQYSPESHKEHPAKNFSKGKEENIAQFNCHLPCENKIVEINKCEVQTTTEMYGTSESLPLNISTDFSTNNPVDKKKARPKVAKKLDKDEKRKQRELEYKKNLHYPKGQRIQVIDHNTFHKILKDSGSLHNENKRSVLSSEEFPALNVMKRNNRYPVLPFQNSSVQSDAEKLRVQDKVANNMGESMKIPESLSVVCGKMVNKMEKKACVPNKLGTGTKGTLKKIGKLPKKRDPIQIDILQCIKMVKPKDAMVEPRKKPRNDSSLLSGNELDSSNPQRSRGKKREKPKKKRPTRLKLIILHERELKNQLKKLQESNLSHTEKACFGTKTSMNLQTVGGVKLEQSDPVTNVSDSEVIETVPRSVHLLAAGGINLEKLECVTNVSDTEVTEIVPGSMNLLTVESIKLEKLEPGSNVSDSEGVETLPGSMDLLAPGGIKLEKVEPVTNVWDTEVVETVPGLTSLLTTGGIKLEKVKAVNNVSGNVVETVAGAEDMSKEGVYKCEVPSSERKTAVAVTNQFLNAEDDSQTYLLSNLHIANNQRYTNERGRVPDLAPPLLCSASDILKKEKQEFTSSEKESCCIVNLKQGQHSIAAADEDIKPTHISSNTVNRDILHSSQIEHCTDSLETVSFTDSDICKKLHQMDGKKFPRDQVCDSSSDHKETMQKTVIYTRKFRPYCDHFITPEINSSVTSLLQDVVKFHDRQFERDPVKANARRRHVTGLREVLKYLNLKRLKLIIIAPDMELIQGKGGICDMVEQLKEGAQNQEIPYVFALQRKLLGKLTFKKVPVSCIGIINYDGTEKNFHSLVAALQLTRAQYQEALTNVCFKDTHSDEVDINKQVIEAALSRLTESS